MLRGAAAGTVMRIDDHRSQCTARSTARERNEAVWQAAGARSTPADIDEFLAYWQPDGRYEVAYPVGGCPAAVKATRRSRELFGAFGGAPTSIAVDDVRFHQTDDPDVAFVEEHMIADLRDGGRYENDLSCASRSATG